MKKHLVPLALPLALLAATGAAAAQTGTVQIYGLIDAGYKLNDPDNVRGVATASTRGIASGHSAGSRVGLRGAESLGGQLKAFFVLENGLQLDTGMADQGGLLFGREASVGVESSFGRISWGRIPNMSSNAGTYAMMGSIDPFLTGFDDAGAQSTFAYSLYRVDNAVAVQTPVVAGLRAGALYSFNVAGAEAAGSDRNNRFAGITFNYVLGKLWTGASYEQQQNAGSTLADDQVIKLGAHYDFGPVKPYLAWSRANGAHRIGDNFSLVGTDVASTSYLVGLTAPLARGVLQASWQKLDGDPVALAGLTAAQSFGRTVASVGYEYPLSKRTALWGVFSRSQGDGALDADATLALGADSAKDALKLANRNTLQVGMRMVF